MFFKCVVVGGLGVGWVGVGSGFKRPGLWLSAVHILCLHPSHRQFTAPPLASIVLSDSLIPRLMRDSKAGYTETAL